MLFWTTVCIAFFCLSQTILYRYYADPLGQYSYTFGIHLLLMCCCHPFHLTPHTPTTITTSSSPYIQTHSWTLVWAVVRGGSRPAATSKMECFVIIVNGVQPVTIIPKHSILDVAAALDPPQAPISVSITVKFQTFLKRDCFFLNTKCLFYNLVVFYASFGWCEKC